MEALWAGTMVVRGHPMRKDTVLVVWGMLRDDRGLVEKTGAQSTEEIL